ncbi:tRNA uridine(34) 5-carboxymethylaminomethyl modification radical SAM/GNAT enzyme Elp3 [Candidatus Pacearchaeota archaeon]|nr:tRNA uridine(34) 5-carboxymethylaminomethyl modification radical SAM/GNAT enzyme Elp3 [Candidatus Pacearchaeota archaeon]
MSTKNKIELGLGVKKPVRSISGVTPLTVVLAPRKCDHGTCIYCPGGEHVPQSYTDKSPAIMRAMKLAYDPYEQVKVRLNVLKLMKHPTDKIEIIILGGTFLQYPKEYKYNFIKKIFDALNNKNSKNLEQAKKINESKSKISIRPSIEELKKQLKTAQLKNEKAKHRCVAMCIENRPDNCTDKDIKEMLEFGATRVEIGVQMPDDKIYKKTNRGHTIQDVIDATEKLKNAGFKLGYHIMPGLPGSNKEKDLKLFKKIFQDEKFRPDQLKIYPCQIIKDSPLEKTYKLIGYTPYNEKETKEILIEFPKEKLIEGLEKLDLRKDIEEEFRNKGLKIGEIRMREIGFNKNALDLNAKIKIIEYPASNGKEYFLEFTNKENILFGLLRLRIFNNDNKSEIAKKMNNFKQLRAAGGGAKRWRAGQTKSEKLKTAIIRELHVYGQALNLGKKGFESQHIGLGKRLMQKAEEICIGKKIKSIKVISGVGVREYYKKLGYALDDGGVYMVKDLN